MKQNTRSYRNHDMMQLYCRQIDDNVVVMRDAGESCGRYECLTKRCKSPNYCRASYLCGGEKESRIPEVTSDDE